MSELLDQIRREGESLQEDLVSYRRLFHAHPELKMETPRTEEKIVEILKIFGIEEIQSHVGGHGVTALIRGKRPGKCLALRSDMDGLPITEETGLPFASQNGAMHACGHDFHMAALLGAAKLLWEHRDALRGTVKLIFQPYEEGDGGAKRMIEAGVLENPKVDAILGMHNGCHIDRPYRAGDVLVTPEPISANIFAFRATFSGSGGHVCLSRTAVNPVYAASEAIVSIRDVAALHPNAVAAVTVCQGGVRNNVIPKTCVIEGSIRSFDREDHHVLREEVLRAVEEAAIKNNASVQTEALIDLVSTRIDRSLYEEFCRTASEVYPEEKPVLLDPPSLIGEDFARYADLVPAFFFYLCAKPEGALYPHHHPKFTVDESVLSKGSVLFAAFALEYLK